MTRIRVFRILQGDKIVKLEPKFVKVIQESLLSHSRHPQQSLYIPNDYKWLHMAETDTKIWFLTRFRVLEFNQGGEMVQIEPKLKKKATNPHNPNWDISNDPYSIPIDYELLEKVEKGTPTWCLIRFRVFRIY